MRSSGFTSVPSALCHVTLGFGIAVNLIFNFAVSFNKHVTSTGLPSTLGLTKMIIYIR
jgi:hypothetical protein